MTGLTKLPHTGLEVPHTRYEITDFQQMTMRGGIAYNATVNEGGRSRGTIENEGNGGGTWFFPHTGEDRHAMAQFTVACRMDGQPLRDEEVFDHLINEHELAQTVAACLRDHQSILRAPADDEGWTTTVAVSIPAIWLGLPDSPWHSQLARELRNKYPATTAWQFWTGEQWQPLTLPTIPS